MQSLSCRAPRIQLVVVYTRRVSSLLTVAPLEQRTLGFSKIAHRVTKEPTWELVPLLRYANQHDPAVLDVLQRCGISSDEWTWWSPIVYSPTFERALDLLQRTHARHHTPSWVVLALASHKIRSPSDAQSALYDLALPLTSLPSPRPPLNKFHAFPLLILTAHSLAYFSLVSLLRPLTSHLIGLPLKSHTHKSFHFNMLLQAISLFDRSRVAADVAIEVLTEMENRGLTLWLDTERVLIRDNFRSPQLLDYFRRRGSSLPGQADKQENSEVRLRAYASLGRVQSSAYYLHAIRKQCLENGVSPPYPAEDGLIDSDGGEEYVQGIAHKANTQYLRAMRDDRQSAFRYFHHLLKLDLTNSHQSPSPALPPSVPDAINKSNIDIYDWTTALYTGARDHTLPASSLLDLFKATKQGTNAYKPTRATYTVVIQGLLWRNALEDAQKIWDEFIGEVVSAQGKGDEENEMRIDRKALCVGIDVLVQSGRTEEGLHLLDEAVKRDIEEAAHSPLGSTSAPPTSNASKPARISVSPYLKVHPIHTLFTALLRIRRPDAIFYIWTHLTSLYFVPPTNLMLRILLKAAMQASKMDGESLKGAMSWYIADNRLFKKQGGPIAPTMTPYKATELPEYRDEPGKEESPSERNSQSTEQTDAVTAADGFPLPREELVAHLHSLLQTPTPPSVVGIWASRRSTEVARSIFRGMIFGNWPALRGAVGPCGGGVTRARARGGESVFQELARVFAGRPSRFLPSHPTHLGTERPTMARPDVGDEQMGPPLPTVIPSESTFAAYISLLGLSSRAEEIPEVLVWMRALGMRPKTETLAVALVFWMEVGLRGPVFEDGLSLTTGSARVSDGEARTAERIDASSRTEYGALRAWIREWVGEKKAPAEEDIHAGIKRVREMRDSQFGKRGGHVIVKDAR